MIRKHDPFVFMSLPAILCLALLASGCAPQSITPTATEDPAAETVAPAASPTNKPSRTPEPTPTLHLTATQTSEPTASMTFTPLPPPDDFSKVKLLSYGALPDWRFMFTFEFGDIVKGEYYLKTVDPKKTFDCRPLTEYRRPERLVCLGYAPAVEKKVQFGLFDANTDALLYAGTIAVPFQ